MNVTIERNELEIFSQSIINGNSLDWVITYFLELVMGDRIVDVYNMCKKYENETDVPALNYEWSWSHIGAQAVGTIIGICVQYAREKDIFIDDYLLSNCLPSISEYYKIDPMELMNAIHEATQQNREWIAMLANPNLAQISQSIEAQSKKYKIALMIEGYLQSDQCKRLSANWRYN